jgi:hypothetical protein
MQFAENRTFDEIAIGDEARFSRTLPRAPETERVQPCCRRETPCKP